jgi:hypothetical protein
MDNYPVERADRFRFRAATFEGEKFSDSARAAGWRWESRDVLLGSDWLSRCRKRGSPRWGNYSWLSPRILLESLNDVVAKRFDDIVPARRQRWMAQQRAAGMEPTDLEKRWDGDPEVMILGDPGEADQSQYAVVKPMLSVSADSGFMVVLSDVIYPAGDINDYVDGFFRPNADYHKPIFAVPGNHDWYDALTGFMFHFCGAEPLPTASYRTAGLTFGQRIAASMWRESSAPNRATLLRHRREEWPVQPAPYFVIDTDSLVYVLIDTGITGSIDREQAEWLIDVSRRLKKNKVLLTGKPIYVDGCYKPCPIVWDDPGQEREESVPYATVDDIVRDPDHRYIAVLGGDTHNYQCTEVTVKVGGRERPIWHVVSGGSGAFLSATHAIPNSRHFFDPRRCDGPTPPGDEVVAFRCYPTRGDSLALFTRRFGHGLFLTLAAATVAAVIAAGLLVGLATMGRVDVPGTGVDPAVVDLAIVALVTLVAIVLSVVGGWYAAVRFLRFLSRWIPGDAKRWPEKPYRGVTAVALGLVVAAGTIALLDLVVHDGTWEWAWTAAVAVVVIVVGVPAATLYSYQSRRGAAGLVRGFLPRLAAVGAVLGSLVVAAGVGLSAAAIGVIMLVIGLVAPAVGLLRQRQPRLAAWLLRALVLLACIAVVGAALLWEWWPGAVSLTVLATLVIALWIAFVVVSWRAMLILPRLRNCRLAPDVAVQRVQEVIGLPAPERPVAATVSRSDQRVCDMLLPPPGKKRLFNAIVSQAAEATGPPFFKQFLRLAIEDEKLVIRCYGVSGWIAEETRPIEQHKVEIPIPAVGSVPRR